MMPPHPSDEHRIRARVQRDAADGRGSRGVTTGDVLLISALLLAVVIVLAVLVFVVFF